MSKTILLFLTIISLSTSSNLRFLDGEKKNSTSGWERIELLSNAATNLANGWKSIVNAFKTTSSRKLRELTKGKGFEYFYGNFQIWLAKGLKVQFYDEYFKRKASQIRVKPNQHHLFLEAVKEVKMMDSNTWGDVNVVFNPKGKQDGTVIAVNLIINSPGNKYNIMITTMNAEFKLAPDIFIEETFKSVAGGIFEKTDYKLIKMPKGLTIEDVQAVLSMYKLISFKMICDIFGIKVNLPEI